MEIVLRDYQTQAVEELREHIRAGRKKLLLSAPTGSGKTEVACFMLQQSLRKGAKALFIVDRVVLVDQTSARLDRYGIAHGVLQAGHWRWRPYESLHVCSAQTLERRGIPPCDVVFVDEAHCQRQKISEFLADTDAVVIGLSATPFTRGLGKLYGAIVNVTTTDKLIAEGHLKPLRYYAAASTIDTKGMKVIAGEWSDADIEARGRAILGDIVQEWVLQTQKHFGGPRKTIVFSATVAHGAELTQRFREAGYDFRQISYLDGDTESRRAIFEEFAKPDSTIQGLVSCEVLTKGFDVPDVQVGISARPYRKSLSSHIQQLGRVMRPYPGHPYGLWLDHAGNVMRFHADTLEFFQNGINALDDGAHDARVHHEPTEKVKAEIRCPCGCVLTPRDTVCPSCGAERKRRALVDVAPGVLQEVGAAFKRNRTSPVEEKAAFFGMLKHYARSHGYASGWASHKYRERYTVWPNNPAVKNAELTPPTQEALDYIRSRAIAWAHARKSA